MSKLEEPTLRLRPRPTETMSLDIPVDTLDTLRRVATNRDMSIQALLKFYIGQGLRQDSAQLYADRILERTAEVLARHMASPEEVAAILQEIHGNAV
jgi:hypothetical protein